MPRINRKQLEDARSTWLMAYMGEGEGEGLKGEDSGRLTVGLFVTSNTNDCR